MKRYGVRPSVRPSVPAWVHNSKPAAADLLLWARRAGDINRLLQQQFTSVYIVHSDTVVRVHLPQLILVLNKLLQIGGGSVAEWLACWTQAQ